MTQRQRRDAPRNFFLYKKQAGARQIRQRQRAGRATHALAHTYPRCHVVRIERACVRASAGVTGIAARKKKLRREEGCWNKRRDGAVGLHAHIKRDGATASFVPMCHKSTLECRSYCAREGRTGERARRTTRQARRSVSTTRPQQSSNRAAAACEQAPTAQLTTYHEQVTMRTDKGRAVHVHSNSNSNDLLADALHGHEFALVGPNRSVGHDGCNVGAICSAPAHKEEHLAEG